MFVGGAHSTRTGMPTAALCGEWARDAPFSAGPVQRRRQRLRAATADAHSAAATTIASGSATNVAANPASPSSFASVHPVAAPAPPQMPIANRLNNSERMNAFSTGLPEQRRARPGMAANRAGPRMLRMRENLVRTPGLDDAHPDG